MRNKPQGSARNVPAPAARLMSNRWGAVCGADG